MILIAAHRVVTSRGDSDINLYYYRKNALPPYRPDGSIDVQRAHEEPGELIELDAAIKPGGNRIPAFIDFVASDDLKAEEAIVFLREAQAELASRRPPLLRANTRCGLYFNTDIGFYQKREQEFSELAARIQRLVEHPPARSLRQDEPLVVLVITDKNGVTFDLEEASSERLRSYRAKKGDQWTKSPVHIAHKTLNDFERLIGGFVGQMAMILTQLDENELLRLGGVKYVDPATGRALAQWPSRKRH